MRMKQMQIFLPLAVLIFTVVAPAPLSCQCSGLL
jgi:hypothetical protein